ncbi:MAG TPA: hypothetical protein VIV64_07825 [Gammaproteobacteria bacterium]|jgi:hypothetical protein
MENRDNARVPEKALGASKVDEIPATRGLVRQISQALKTDVRDWYERHRRNDTTKPLVWTFYLQLILLVGLLILLPFDTAEVEGRARLVKPLNFTGSFAVYLAVVVIIVDYLRTSDWWKKVISWGISACIFVAITCITLQAARGTTSHFNQDTSFDLAVSVLMDIVDPLNSIFVFVLLVFALQSKLEVSPPTQLGFVFGLIIFLAGGVVGGVMVFQGQSTVGVAPGSPGLPVLNWSTMGGDLRVAHFLGVHAIQILPIAGWLINQVHFFGRSMRAKRIQVVAVSSAYVLFMGYTFMQAMQGSPLVSV